jgi:hypothetical protein
MRSGVIIQSYFKAARAYALGVQSLRQSGTLHVGVCGFARDAPANPKKQAKEKRRTDTKKISRTK